MTDGRLKIGQVARMIGISPETLRYYERKGIICPDKEEKSQYRTYNMQDVCVLIRVRMYLQYGFTLDEARQMVYEKDETYTDQVLRTRIQAIDDEVDRLMETRRNMSNRYLELLDVMRSVDQYSIQERPPLALLEIYNGHMVGGEKVQREYSKWVNKSLDSFPYVEYTLDENSEIQEAAVGQGIFLPAGRARTSEFITQGGSVSFYNACPCLRTGIVAYQSKSEDGVTFLKSIIQYMQTNNLSHKGNIFARTIYVGREESRYKYFRDIWIPLGEKK